MSAMRLFELDELELRVPCPVDRDDFSDEMRRDVIQLTAAEMVEAERLFMGSGRRSDDDFTNDDFSDLWRDGE